MSSLPEDGQDCTDMAPDSQRTARVAKILIVEDSPDNMKLFRTLLTLKGHEVTGLSGGEGLLDAIERRSPRSGSDGHPAAGQGRLRATAGDPESPAAVRVVALTAHAMTGDRERALQAGFDGYITKPIDIRGFPDRSPRVAGRAPEASRLSPLEPKQNQRAAPDSRSLGRPASGADWEVFDQLDPGARIPRGR